MVRDDAVEKISDRDLGIDWAYRYNKSGRNKVGHLYAYTTLSGTNDLLSHISDNRHQDVNVVYGSSNRKEATEESYPFFSLKMHDNVVKSIEHNKGGGYSNKTEYEFYDKKYYSGNGDRHEKKMLGFKEVHTTKTLKSSTESVSVKEKILYNQYKYLGNGRYETELAGSIAEASTNYPNKNDVLNKITNTYELKNGLAEGCKWVTDRTKDRDLRWIHSYSYPNDGIR